MTEYNGEQNNILGAVQPVEVSPVEAEPVAVAQPQVAEPVATQYQAPVVPGQIPVAPVYQAPAEPQPPKKSKTPIFIGIGIGAFVIGLIIALVLMFVLGDNKDDDKTGKDNETQTEQVDDNAQSEDNDEDNDEKDNVDTSDDSSAEDDKTNEDDDVDVDIGADVPKEDIINAPYSDYLDAFASVLAGDVHSFGRIIPDDMWNLIRFALAEELGYTPSKDEVLEIMIEEVFSDSTEDDFADEATYSISSEEVVTDEDIIGKLQEGASEYMIFDDIEEVYEVTFTIRMEKDGEIVNAEDTAYAVLVDGEWFFMSKNYDIYVFDCTILNDLFSQSEGNFI